MNFRQPLHPIGMPTLTALLALFLFGCAEIHQQSANSTSQQAVQVGRGSKPCPKYPELALRNDWQGNVVLRVVVRSNCRAASIEVAQSSGHEILDDAAKDCVSKWRFRPEEVGTNMESIAFILAK